MDDSSTPSSKPIFISHAVADTDIADKVVDLLQTGMNISSDEIFCSSLSGLGVPVGSNFKDFIRKQIVSPNLVILLISKNYLSSHFCVAELGACWVLSHNVIPILIPPVEFSDMGEIIKDKQAIFINEESGWNSAFEEIGKILNKRPNFSRWNTKRTPFLNEIAFLIKSQTLPPIISQKDHEVVTKRLAEANKKLTQKEVEIKNLNSLIEKLKNAKDKTEVARIEQESLPEWEHFENLVEDAKSKLSIFNLYLKEIFYNKCSGEEGLAPEFGTSAYEENSRAINDAMARKILIRTDEGFELNHEKSNVDDALTSIGNLRNFINKSTERFLKFYNETYSDNPVFSSKDFWEEHLF